MCPATDAPHTVLTAWKKRSSPFQPLYPSLVRQAQFAARNKPRLDDRNDSLKHWGGKYIDLAFTKYKGKHVGRILGKEAEEDWDELVKEAKGEFDVRVYAGPGKNLDPETILNNTMQLVERGVLGEPGSPDAQLAVLTAIRSFWPGAEMRIRKLKKAIKLQESGAAQAEAGTLTPSGGPAVAPAAPSSIPPAASPAPVPVGV